MATSSEPYVAPVVTDPVVLHLVDGNTELGVDLIPLARNVEVPLTFDLLRLTPVEARFELSHRCARAVLGKETSRDVS
jgi:hypothetical protein